MVRTHFRPEERTPDEPDPDDPGLFIPGETEGLPVVDRTGRRIGGLHEGYVYSGSIERITIRLDPELRASRSLPDTIDVEAHWLDRREDHMQLDKTFEEALDRLGFT